MVAAIAAAVAYVPAERDALLFRRYTLVKHRHSREKRGKCRGRGTDKSSSSPLDSISGGFQ